MIKKIDWLLNRLLFSMHNLDYCFTLVVYTIGIWLVVYPLYCLPCWKRRLKEREGISTFKEYTEGITNHIKIIRQYGGAMILLALPMYLVVDVWAICYGPSASEIIRRHLVIVTACGIVPSWILCDLTYWKKNRYLKYFAIFEKESVKKKAAWIIVTILVFVLLIVANLFLIWYYGFLY